MNKTILFLGLTAFILAGAASAYADAQLMTCGSHGQSLESCEAATAEGNYCVTPAGAAPSTDTIGKCKYRIESDNPHPQCQCVVNQAADRSTPLIS